jgi:hypothetical protein
MIVIHVKPQPYVLLFRYNLYFLIILNQYLYIHFVSTKRVIMVFPLVFRNLAAALVVLAGSSNEYCPNDLVLVNIIERTSTLVLPSAVRKTACSKMDSLLSNQL